MSITSSPPPDKPSECSSDIWNLLGDLIEEPDEVTEENKEKENIIICSLPEQKIQSSTVLPEKEPNVIILKIVDLNSNESIPIIKERPTQENELGDDAIDKNEETVATKNTRKRKRNPEEWKQNVRRRKRQHGEKYIDVKGNERQERKVRGGLCHSNSCNFKCSSKITDEERKLINEMFWKLNDNEKMHFYSKHIEKTMASRKRTEKTVSKKKFSFKYHFFINGVEVRVCQEYFLNTLNVSKQRVYYFFKKHQHNSTNIPLPLKHGKHTKKLITEKQKDEVRAHINSFPAIESHYCRATTTRKYLDRNLNIQKMYNLYLVSGIESPVKFHLYKSIFNNEFNIGFFKPKKDLCDKCFKYSITKEKDEELISEYEEHIKRKNVGNIERDRDRKKYNQDKTTAVVTFDLQNTFSLPMANVSNFYYRTKLSCYNLTAHLSTTRTIYNAVWNEFICGRGGVHIANALIRILKALIQDNPEITKLILWSDSCVPQNRNSILSFALQNFLNSEESLNLQYIEQKFSEPGHGNVQEIDAAHSLIERHIKHLEIWSPLHLITILSDIPKTWKNKFIVKQMREKDYKNYSLISSKYNYNTIPYTKLKHIVYQKNSMNVKYAEDFSAELKTVKLSRIQKKGSKTISNTAKLEEIIPIVKLKSTIPAKKKKDLCDMMNFMPEERDKNYYKIMISKAETKSESTEGTCKSRSKAKKFK